MGQPVLFVHGGGQGAYEETAALVAFLRDALGSGYDVRYPQMPDPGSPRYAAWRDQIQAELASVRGAVILVGHSLGGSILLKYLSEEPLAQPVAGLFLLAPPYWGTEDWEVEEYVLTQNFADTLPRIPSIVLYHNRDDEVVPLAHQALYAEQLPQATIRTFDNRGHQFQNNLPELVEEINEMGLRAGT